jgi:hypothetical protein
MCIYFLLFLLFSLYQIMYRDRSVALNRIIRDIKSHINAGILMEMPDGTYIYNPHPTIHITDIMLHAACCESWYDGKYIVRVDEFAVNYTDDNNCTCTYRKNFRYDCYCDDPDIHSTIVVIYDKQSTEPYIRTTVGQKSIVQHIERYPSTDAVEPFWIRVKAEQDSFKPKDSAQPIMYHKLSVAENFV